MREDRRGLLCLWTGGAAVVHVGGDREGRTGVFSHIGHYVVAVSEGRDGRIIILDPSYKEGKQEEEGRKGLVDDATNREPNFYLFWRK